MTDKILRSASKRYTEELLETINALVNTPAHILATFTDMLTPAELIEAIEDNTRDAAMFERLGDVEMSHLKALVANRMRELVERIESGAGNVTHIDPGVAL